MCIPGWGVLLKNWQNRGNIMAFVEHWPHWTVSPICSQSTRQDSRFTQPEVEYEDQEEDGYDADSGQESMRRRGSRRPTRHGHNDRSGGGGYEVRGGGSTLFVLFAPPLMHRSDRLILCFCCFQLLGLWTVLRTIDLGVFSTIFPFLSDAADIVVPDPLRVWHRSHQHRPHYRRRWELWLIVCFVFLTCTSRSTASDSLLLLVNTFENSALVFSSL